ncbi:TIR domain-containing protein [Paratractidigestivibacter faecalis]|uniref:TIR domain-containing protein n=1 Tax=Paratractidigestivibacter faecalis TaxID=2292441 RepID=UPI003AB5B4FB
MSTLQHWNESSRWGLSFVDAHELTQARDTSLPCSIKRSLRERLDASKTFVLVVGDKTKDLQGRLQILRKLLALWRLP